MIVETSLCWLKNEKDMSEKGRLQSKMLRIPFCWLGGQTKIMQAQAAEVERNQMT
jgi:hypothetical protein